MGACLVKQDSNSRGSVVVPYSSPPAKRAPLRLYGSETCPYTAQIRIALEFKGIPVQVSWVNDCDDGNNSDMGSNSRRRTVRRMLEFSEKPIDPTKAISGSEAELPILEHHGAKSPGLEQHSTKLPMLECHGHRVCGSSDAILKCIEANFPKPSLRMHHKEVSAMASFVRDMFNPAMTRALYGPENSDCAGKELESAFAKLDGAMAKHASKGPYFYGNRFTLVDVYLIPFLLLDRPLAHLRGIEISSKFAHLRSYSARMTSFASYAPIRMDVDVLNEHVWGVLSRDSPPPLVAFTLLQHESILGHFERLVLALDGVLVAMKEPSRAVDPVKGSLPMQLKRLSTSYTHLLELMLEHAQMEERVIFPSLEKADRGITKSANESHARHLPLMNGIKEDLKGVASLEKGSPGIKEALHAATSRLRTLQMHNMEHFHEEETELLPLLNAAGMGSKQQAGLVGKCVEMMESSHGSKLAFLLSGLRPHRVHRYMDVLRNSLEHETHTALLKRMMIQLRESGDNGDEFAGVWQVVKTRVPTLAALATSSSSS